MHILYKSKHPISLELDANKELQFVHDILIEREELHVALETIKEQVTAMTLASLPVELPNTSEFLYFSPEGFYQASNLTLRKILGGFVFNNIRGEQYYIPIGILENPDEYGEDDGPYQLFENGVRVPTAFVRWFKDIEFSPALHITPAVQVDDLTEAKDSMVELARYELHDYTVTVQDIKDEGTWLYIENKHDMLNFACKINLFALKSYSHEQWINLFNWHETLAPDGLEKEYLPEIIREAEYFKYVERV